MKQKTKLFTLLFLVLLSITVIISKNKQLKVQSIDLQEKTSQEVKISVTEPIVYDKQKIQERVKHYAAYYGVSEKVMLHIVEKESSYNVRATAHNDGIKGCTARGLSQLNSCFMGKGIPPEDAYNPEFALDILARKLKAGQCKQWSTCPYNA